MWSQARFISSLSSTVVFMLLLLKMKYTSLLLDPNNIVQVPWYMSAFKRRRRRDVDGVSDGVILKTPSATSGM